VKTTNYEAHHYAVSSVFGLNVLVSILFSKPLNLWMWAIGGFHGGEGLYDDILFWRWKQKFPPKRWLMPST